MSTTLFHPLDRPAQGDAEVPRSKPHMQRAILLSLLANAPSIIARPAWSSESRDLCEAARQFGLDVAGAGDAEQLVLTGTGRSLRQPGEPVWTAGSAFNFRTIVALACLVPGETVIEGNRSMLARPVVRYLNFVADLGARLEDISDPERVRVRVRGSRRLGGETVIDTTHSSQALTAALLIAPLAGEPVRIRCDERGQVGEGYVDLTLDLMRRQGAIVTRDGGSFVIAPGPYQSRLHLIPSDFTAMSYLAAIVAVAQEAEISVADYQPSSLSSEQEFLAVLRRLGIDTSHDPVTRTLLIRRTAPEAASIEIDGCNIPTVVPALAAIAPFVEAAVTVRNVAHVNNHKCARVSVMVQELSRMGCRITAVRRADGAVDGFSAAGPQRPSGGVVVDSHGDHRIFMSLAVAALGARSATCVSGTQHLGASFPGFLDVLSQLGARSEPGIGKGAGAQPAIAITSAR